MNEDQEPPPDADSLYRAYADPLLRFVRRVAADRGLSESLVDTEAVMQEAFLAMLRFGGTIHNPPAWLFTVARRMVGKIAAAHQRRRAEGDPADHLVQAETVRWASVAPRASTEDIAEARRVLAGIAELSNRQRIAVYLRHVEGWTTAEISAYLVCAPATTSVHIHRGTRLLRNRLRPAVLRSGDRDKHRRDWPGLLLLVWALCCGLVAVLVAVLGPLVVKVAVSAIYCPPESALCPLPGLDTRVPDLGMLVVVFGLGALVGLLIWLGSPSLPRAARRRRRVRSRVE